MALDGVANSCNSPPAMIVNTLFNHGGNWEKGEIEIQLMPGIPSLHVVGLPDAQIKESGIKLKSALKACGFRWPRGNQIIVNLRPNHFRKSCAGAELAIALGFLLKTGQLPEAVGDCARKSYVYGEVALDGRVIAPHDLPLALRAADDHDVLTGTVSDSVREGSWAELSDLKSREVTRRQRFFDWENYWRAPSRPNVSLHPGAAEALVLTLHMNLHVLLAGPQGSGKSTWARILYSLTEPPDPGLFVEREELVGREELRWRPLEQPHHSITPLAMVGGGYPIAPGVISRAHGGILVMDEFLEFNSAVLENLREPLETGRVEIARKGAREVIPARFQLVATTNLCPCGKLIPNGERECPLTWRQRCSRVVSRLSGPLLDRFDMLLYSHDWIDRSVGRVDIDEVVKRLACARDFARLRGNVPMKVPERWDSMTMNHRRRAALLRVARGLADMACSNSVKAEHFNDAERLVVAPIEALNKIFS